MPVQKTRGAIKQSQVKIILYLRSTCQQVFNTFTHSQFTANIYVSPHTISARIDDV